MKNMVKKNQIMITALAIMIAVAGYLNFAGGRITDEEIMATGTDSAVIADEAQMTQEDTEVASLFEISDEAVENQISDTQAPGEAVFTSSASLDTLSGAKLMKEQVRAKNKETLMEIINNVNISEEQKQEAVDNMIAITDVAEKETAAEILLESKGFDDVVVSITDSTVDVVVNASDLSEAQRAQIEDIVVRKTGIGAENIIISTIAQD